MAKRTVTRWVTQDWREGEIGRTNRDAYRSKRLDIQIDDGLPEPERKCPCVDEHKKAVGVCCAPGGSHCFCCGNPYSEGTTPCTNAFHKPKTDTRDRVVDGCCTPMGTDFTTLGRCDVGGHPESFSVEKNHVPATLIIHEPVKEPTLVEAVEALVKARNSGLGYTHGDVLAVIEALAREKGKR